MPSSTLGRPPWLPSLLRQLRLPLPRRHRLLLVLRRPVAPPPLSSQQIVNPEARATVVVEGEAGPFVRGAVGEAVGVRSESGLGGGGRVDGVRLVGRGGGAVERGGRGGGADPGLPLLLAVMSGGGGREGPGGEVKGEGVREAGGGSAGQGGGEVVCAKAWKDGNESACISGRSQRGGKRERGTDG